MENIGYIYKIINTINGKVYIGQTTRTVESRMKQHFVESKRDRSKKYSLYRAFNKYGIDSFIVETLCECDVSELNNKEIEYISLFNSYKKGYNGTLGGGGFKTLEISDEEIIKTYLKNKSIQKTCKELNTSFHSKVSDTLQKYNIDKFENKISVSIYKDEKLIKECESLLEAAIWVIENKLTKETNKNSVSSYIRKSIIANKNAYGYKFKSDFYNEEYLKNKDISYITNTYDSEHRRLRNKRNHKKQNNYKECPTCGKKMYRTSEVCRMCSDKERYGNKLDNINREHLKELIRTTPFTTIANQYKVSDNAIRKWCRKYNLPYKSSEIKKYTDEEWKSI